MIDDIVEIIITEASKRPGKDRVTAILNVMMEIDRELINIIVTALDIEKRNKENENQG